jgi:hypothetical protein
VPQSYSDDLGERVIEVVEAGASRREATESFNLSPSSAVTWLQAGAMPEAPKQSRADAERQNPVYWPDSDSARIEAGGSSQFRGLLAEASSCVQWTAR